MGCLNCGKELVHTPGKRPKKFCSNSCRSGYSQKKKKGKEGGPKRGPGRPVFKSRIVAPSSEPVIQPEKPFPQKEDETVRVFRDDGSEILPTHNEPIHFKKGTFIIDNEKNQDLYAAAIAFSSPAPEVFDVPLSNTIQDEHPKYFTPANQPVVDKLGKVLVEAKKTPQRAASQSTESFMGHPIPKGLKGIELSIWKAEIKDKNK